MLFRSNLCNSEVEYAAQAGWFRVLLDFLDDSLRKTVLLELISLVGVCLGMLKFLHAFAGE